MPGFGSASTRQPFDFQAQVIVRPDFQLHGWYFIVSSFFEVHAAKDVYDAKTPAKHRGCWLVSTAFKVRRYSSKPWMKERLLNILAVGTEISRNPYLCPSWIQAVDNNLVDSAFSHNTLLHKLKIQFGIESNLLSWLTCNLNHRTQVTVVNSPQSEELLMICGFPQGSGLGLCLFGLCTNDMPKALILGNFYLCPSDTTVYSTVEEAFYLQIMRLTSFTKCAWLTR